LIWLKKAVICSVFFASIAGVLTYRGNDYGYLLWQQGIDYLKTCPTIGLDGVVAQQNNYQKSGFKSVYRHLRFGGKPSAIAPVKVAKQHIDIRRVPISELLEYETSLFMYVRPTLLAAWISLPESHGLVAYETGRIKGYGVIRPSFSGYRIGPLFADDLATAEELYNALCLYVMEDKQVFIDLPDANPLAIKLAESQHLTLVFEAARMYRGEIPQVDINRIYSVLSLELG
jgi:hypothetical protein